MKEILLFFNTLTKDFLLPYNNRGDYTVNFRRLPDKIVK